MEKDRDFVCNLKQLQGYFSLNIKEREQLQKVIKIHPMRISKYYVSLINPKDKNDPIRKMIVPSEKELVEFGEYDTSGEKENTKTPGLQHKYSETALILSTNTCTAYCRYCFRKRFVGIKSKEILKRFNKAVEYIKKHKEITNVLISGGDPFTLKTNILKKFLKSISKIEHLKFIRFGTKVPVTFPKRILKDKTLIKVLKKYSKKKRIYIVTHFNHPREITKESTKAINELTKSNIIVGNQTVLLKGVNDHPKILIELMKKLVSIGVVPYYVFQCRPVKRVKNHFQIPFYQGIKIIDKAKAKLDGHAKRFKYVMSHKTGKIEIIGTLNNEIYFKYNQAKDSKNFSRFFRKKLNKKACWLEELH